MRFAFALALAAVAAPAALPARAAVIQTASIHVDLGDDLLFNPARPDYGLTFDALMGTLNAVTLRFDGDVGVFAEAFITGPMPHPTEFTTDVTLTYGGLYGVSLGTLVAPITTTEFGPDMLYGRGSTSEPQSFALTIPATDYGKSNVYLEQRFHDNPFVGYATPPGAYFYGSVFALFDYTPPAQSVPEPAPFALLGIGPAGLAAARRRAG